MQVNCPYCGNMNTIPPGRKEGASLLTCDIDDSPGCDQQFVIHLKVKRTISTMRIEGMKDKPVTK